MGGQTSLISCEADLQCSCVTGMHSPDLRFRVLVSSIIINFIINSSIILTQGLAFNQRASKFEKKKQKQKKLTTVAKHPLQNPAAAPL